MRNIHNDITSGKIENNDFRSMQLALPCILKKAMMVSLLAMVDEGYGQTLPTPDGTVCKQYIEFPYTQYGALAQELCFFMMKRTHGQDVDVEMYKKSFIVSLTTMRRAIEALHDERDIVISVCRTKKFMRCSTCAKFDDLNQKTVNMDDRNKIHIARSEHIQQVKIERAAFESLRDLAK